MKALISLVTAVVLVALPDPGPARAATTPPQLTEHVVIRVRTSGWTTVQLTRDVTVKGTVKARGPEGPNPHVRIRSRALTSGFALVADPYGPLPEENRYLFAARFADCLDDACARRRGYLNTMSSEIDGEKDVQLLAGRYALHVFTDGAPVRIDLELQGAPRGSTVVSPGDGATADVRFVAGDAIDQSGTRSWSAGASFETGDVGISMSLLHLKGKDMHPDAFGICIYDYPAPPPDAAGYGPHCDVLTRAVGSGYTTIWPPGQDGEDEIVIGSVYLYNDAREVFQQNQVGRRGLGAWAIGRGIETTTFQAATINLAP